MTPKPMMSSFSAFLGAQRFAQDPGDLVSAAVQVIDPFDLGEQTAAFHNGALQRQGAERRHFVQLRRALLLFQQDGEI